MLTAFGIRTTSFHEGSDFDNLKCSIKFHLILVGNYIMSSCRLSIRRGNKLGVHEMSNAHNVISDLHPAVIASGVSCFM